MEPQDGWEAGGQLWGSGGCAEQRRQGGKGRRSWHKRAQAGGGVQSPRSAAATPQ